MAFFVLFALVSGYRNYAATVHDYLYTCGYLSRKEADAVLYRALRAEGVARWQSWIIWVGVRLGGAKHDRIPTSSGFLCLESDITLWGDADLFQFIASQINQDLRDAICW